MKTLRLTQMLSWRRLLPKQHFAGTESPDSLPPFDGDTYMKASADRPKGQVSIALETGSSEDKVLEVMKDAHQKSMFGHSPNLAANLVNAVTNEGQVVIGAKAINEFECDKG